MNLQGITAGLVGAVNTPVAATIWPSNGYTTAGDGTQIPAYLAPVALQVQSQALQYDDLKQLDGLNIQGERRAVYMQGNWNGVVRADQKGGDILGFADHPGGPVRYWLVALVAESWPDWTKVICTLQKDQSAPA